MYKKKPFFIVFEGVEGCGKSFQSRKLYNYFNKAVDAFDIVKLPTQSNTPYYPYFIYKSLKSHIVYLKFLLF